MAGEDGKWGEFVMFVEETLSEEEEQVDDESKINKFIEDVQNMVCTVAQRPFVAKEAAESEALRIRCAIASKSYSRYEKEWATCVTLIRAYNSSVNLKSTN